ncbi:MAG: glycogen debranching N-terminal domain-containing protein [Acidimicrobiia bacterium]
MSDTPSTGPVGEITLVESESFCVSGSSGQMRRGGEQGLYIRDIRVLDRLILRLDGNEPVTLSGRGVSPSAARFTGYWRAEGDTAPDPRLFVDRRRTISASLWEETRLVNYGLDPVEVVVELETGSDFASIFDVKHGRMAEPVSARKGDGGLRLASETTAQTTILRPQPPADESLPDQGILRWHVRLAPRTRWTLTLSVGLEEAHGTVWPARTWATDAAPAELSPPTWKGMEVVCSDGRVTQLAQRSIADLATLIVSDPLEPDDRFFAAGSPWYLTLFGRDSLWAAFMALPLDPSIASQTLRVLARRQGTRHDPATEEAPGKILHEVRHGGLGDRSDFPPLYYGTMDATPLWVLLLHEAWCWGMADGEVAALLPNLERALGWLRDDGDPDGDGFLEYRRSTERSLENQGWKDSSDGIQFADGRLADPPISLCEVQGYAYEAAIRGAELLDHFGRDGGDEWRAWAARLRDRFRESFWVPGDEPYPALALDGVKNQIDGIASNMGHLPGTGLVDEREAGAIARRLTRPDMNSGWGLRTLSDQSPRFNPLSYHGGSVWPHDTAIAVHQLALAGFGREATALLRGLIRTAPHFEFRLPELFSGEQRQPGGFPLPYPAACRPQAWAAGAALLMLRAALGLHPDLPNGCITLRPIWPFPFRQLYVGGMTVGTGELSITVVGDAGVFVHSAPAGVRIEIIGAPVLDTEPLPAGPLLID